MTDNRAEEQVERVGERVGETESARFRVGEGKNRFKRKVVDCHSHGHFITSFLTTPHHIIVHHTTSHHTGNTY